jgi:O-antigen/teichoic acid export membrane protein
MFRYSGALLCRLLWVLYAASDRAILGRLTGNLSLGFFAMASQIALKPLDVSLIVNQLAGPLLAEVQGDVQVMRTCLARSIRIVAWITLPMCVGMLLVAEDAVRIVLTEKWLRGH